MDTSDKGRYHVSKESYMDYKSKKKFGAEFKAEAVRRSYGSGKPVTQVAHELGISPPLLYRWRDEIRKEGVQAFPGKGKKTNQSAEQSELEQLRRENKRLKQEQEILKKTLVYLAVERVKDTDASKNNKDDIP